TTYPKDIELKMQRLFARLSGKGCCIDRNFIKALQALFKAIVSTAVGLQRRKSQSRAIKRRPKPYSLLTITRHEACATL
ncbi:MAG: hypothetical protein ACXW04_06170, partial [Methylobacter sp.]